MERYKINGVGPQGSTIGLWEYLSQSNDNANSINESERFKFVDDLSIIEIINLITVGLTSYNFHNHVASDIGINNSYIPSQNLNSQKYINNIESWTEAKKIKLNQDKIYDLQLYI